jgi:hypothetical protein
VSIKKQVKITFAERLFKYLKKLKTAKHKKINDKIFGMRKTNLWDPAKW